MRFLYSLLCIGLFVTAEVRASAGQGWYLAGQAGAGVVAPTVDGDEYVQTRLKRLLKNIGVESSWFPWPGAQLLWGYSYRFDNNITLGFESVVISPTVRLGYIINDAHHISVVPRYALATQLFFNWGHNHLREEFYKENPGLKNTIDVNFHALSGGGVSLMYEYFFPSKRFIRLEVRGDYYGADVTIKAPEAWQALLDVESFKGRGYVWDATVYLGFGTQW